MTMNRMQFQPGLSMAEFMDRYGSDDKCEAALIESRWPAAFACPACGCGPDQLVSARGPAVLSVYRAPAPVQRHERHDLRVDQAAIDALVPSIWTWRPSPRTTSPLSNSSATCQTRPMDRLLITLYRLLKGNAWLKYVSDTSVQHGRVRMRRTIYASKVSY